jgi:hypothetical protein
MFLPYVGHCKYFEILITLMPVRRSQLDFILSVSVTAVSIKAFYVVCVDNTTPSPYRQLFFAAVESISRWSNRSIRLCCQGLSTCATVDVLSALPFFYGSALPIKKAFTQSLRNIGHKHSQSGLSSLLPFRSIVHWIQLVGSSSPGIPSCHFG